jgi:hypothetical protein
MKYLILVLVVLASCNPVKKVLKDQNKFEQVAKVVVASGKYCITDTAVVETVKDSIIYKDSLIEKQVKVPCADFDTAFNSTSIKVVDGVLTYSHTCKNKEVQKIVTKVNNIRDRAFEGTLKDTILLLKGRISGYGDDIAILMDSVNKQEVKIKTVKKEARSSKIKLWLIIVLMGAWIVRKPLLRLAGVKL